MSTSRLVLVQLAFFSLVACNNDIGNANTVINGNPQIVQMHYKQQLTTQQLPYTMGGTYDSMSGYPASAQSCFNAGFDSHAIKIINPQATINFNAAQSLQEVENALGVNVAITMGWGPFSYTTGYSYANSSQDDAYTLNLNYIYQYSGTAEFKNKIIIFSRLCRIFNTSSQLSIGIIE